MNVSHRNKDARVLEQQWLEWWTLGYWLNTDARWRAALPQDCVPQGSLIDDLSINDTSINDALMNGCLVNGSLIRGYSPEMQYRLSRHHGLEVGLSLGIRQDAPPGPPDRRILSWAALSVASQETALTLALVICAPHLAAPSLSPAQQIWCRRLAKALRPESWLPATPSLDARAASLFLLRAAVSDGWSRLRWQFAPADVERTERPPVNLLPTARLHALWDAVLWQSRQLDEKNHVAD